MLVQLLPDQIARMWDAIKFSLEETLPPTVVVGPNTFNNILTAALCDKMQVWFGVSKEEDGRNRLDAIIVTTMSVEEVSGTKSLLIYSAYAYETLSLGTWKEYLTVGQKFAKARNCQHLAAYTDNERIRRVVRNLEGSKELSFVSIPL